MKKFTIIYLVIVLAQTAKAQLPNPGFENWFNSVPCPGDQLPVGWSDNWYPVACLSVIYPSTNSHSGVYAAAISKQPWIGMGTHNAELTTGATDNAGNFLTHNFHVTAKPQTLSCYISFAGTNIHDTLVTYFNVYHQNTLIGTLNFKVLHTSNNMSTPVYQLFTGAVNYTSVLTADSASFLATFTCDTCGAMTEGLLDDMSVTYVTGINEHVGEKTISLFPNPAADKINIEGLEISASTYQFSIYDIEGREVKKNTEQSLDTQIDIRDLKEGIYMINIISDDKFYNSKLVVIR